MQNAATLVFNNNDLSNYIYSFDSTYKDLYYKSILEASKCSIYNIYKKICKKLIDNYILTSNNFYGYRLENFIWFEDGYYNHDKWYGENNIDTIKCECVFSNTEDNVYLELLFIDVYYNPNDNIYLCEMHQISPVLFDDIYYSEYQEFMMDYDY
jgi:hypothetical protein